MDSPFSFLFYFLFSYAREDKPNVILFLVDDLGYTDLSLTGSTFYETPNLDIFGQAGSLFDNAYAANPVCSPTGGVLTGKYPSRIGLTNHSGSSGARGPKYLLEPPAVKGNIPAKDLTVAEAFKKHGYNSAHIGKWHLQAHQERRKALPRKPWFRSQCGRP